MTTPPQTISDKAPKVPDELIDQMHEANQKLHEMRKQIEETHENFDADLGNREAALDQFRKADGHLDEVRKQIDEAIRPRKSSVTADKKAHG